MEAVAPVLILVAVDMAVNHHPLNMVHQANLAHTKLSSTSVAQFMFGGQMMKTQTFDEILEKEEKKIHSHPDTQSKTKVKRK